MNNLSKYLSKEELDEIANMKDEYDKALALVTILFKNKVDKENIPYVEHLKRVSDLVINKDTKVSALLHDTLEDINGITYDDLINIGFKKEIVDIVKIVTMDDSKSYHDFITSILESNNIEAIKLKYADMMDNTNKERISKLDIDTRKKLENKYYPELERLKEFLERRQ